jgi:phosphosulfolactate phosphohydrolase-like enzyme
MLVEEFERVLGSELTLQEGAMAAKTLAKEHRADILTAVRSSRHGRELEAIGFGQDVGFCASLDAVPVVPVLRQGKIILAAAQ